MAEQRYIYTFEHMTKRHADRVVLNDVTLSFIPGAKIGVLGKNGAGKSTLLRIMSGMDTEVDGRVQLMKGYTVDYLSQEPRLDPNRNVFDNVMDAVAPVRQLLIDFDKINAKFAEPMSDKEMDKTIAEQAKLQDEIDRVDAWNLERRVEIAMDAMRLPPGDAEVSKLSGGEKRRINLCQILLKRPDLLLLDEPTNHLDADSVLWLERHLAEYEGTIVAVTHDRYFLDHVAQWILEIDRGRCYPYEGNYSVFLQKKQERLRMEEKRESARQKTLQRELDWIRMSPKARMKKSKARIAAYDKLAAESLAEREDEFEMFIPPSPPLGDLVIEANDISKSFGDNLLFENVSFRIPPGGIVGVIGPNGAGKTTLFKMMMGVEKPDTGSIRFGETVSVGYIDQSRDHLDDSKTVWQEISEELEFFEFGTRRVNTRAYVSQFNFKGTDQQKLVGNLSGGERNRVHLAKLLKRGTNVLLMDEPTNDLDVDTLRAMEEAILNFAGSVIVVSHDRYFLDRIATHILAFEGNSYVHWCEGNYETYIEQRHERLGTDADEPHRIKYKKLIH